MSITRIKIPIHEENALQVEVFDPYETVPVCWHACSSQKNQYWQPTTSSHGQNCRRRLRLKKMIVRNHVLVVSKCSMCKLRGNNNFHPCWQAWNEIWNLGRYPRFHWVSKTRVSIGCSKKDQSLPFLLYSLPFIGMLREMILELLVKVCYLECLFGLYYLLVYLPMPRCLLNVFLQEYISFFHFHLSII